MERLELRVKPSSLVKPLAGSVGFVIVGLACFFAKPELRPVGWLFLSFGLVMSAGFAWVLRGQGPRVTIDNSGVAGMETRMMPVPWEDIQGVRLMDGLTGGSRWMILDLRPESKALGNLIPLSKLSQKADGADHSICFSVGYLSLTPEEIVSLVEQRLLSRLSGS